MKSPDSGDSAGISNQSVTQQRELAWALLHRPKRGDDGRAAFRRNYPTAPEEMITTAAHHVYVDGPDAVVAFLAEAELAIREPGYEMGYGTSYEVLYHLYNWLQFRAILPEGKADLMTLLAQMKQAVAEDDRAFILSTVQELEDILEGSRHHPDFEVP